MPACDYCKDHIQGCDKCEVDPNDDTKPIDIQLVNAPGITAMIAIDPGSNPLDFARAVDALVRLKDMIVGQQQARGVARSPGLNARPAPEYRRPRNRR